MRANKILKMALTALVTLGSVQTISAVDAEFVGVPAGRLQVMATRLKVENAAIRAAIDPTVYNILNKDSVATIADIKAELTAAADTFANLRPGGGANAVLNAAATGVAGLAGAFAANPGARMYAPSPADVNNDTLVTSIKAVIAASVIPPVVFPAGAAPVKIEDIKKIDREVKAQIASDVADNFIAYLANPAAAPLVRVLGANVLDAAVVTVDDLVAAVPGAGIAAGAAIPGAQHGEVAPAAGLTQAEARALIQRRNNLGITNYPQDDTLQSLVDVVRVVLEK
ncbi:MAG: hypothetical protein K0R76_331 [Alphaproteobacteria bacterium]|jgi:hypothetical protein|nr:hypothetical protein [Alphaproteobacteria bacterium]